MSKLILFVCTGNTCRSPMAEYYFNYKSHGGLRAVSRGIYAETGGFMAENAKQVLLAGNIVTDTGGVAHRPMRIDEEIMREAVLIYGMTENHANILCASFPAYADKIYAMPENIGDPYGSGPEVYAECFERIRSAVDIIIKDLQRNGHV